MKKIYLVKDEEGKQLGSFTVYSDNEILGQVKEFFNSYFLHNTYYSGKSKNIIDIISINDKYIIYTEDSTFSMYIKEFDYESFLKTLPKFYYGYFLRVLTDKDYYKIYNVIDEFGFQAEFEGSFTEKMENDVKKFGVRLDEYYSQLNDKFGLFDFMYLLTGENKTKLEEAAKYILSELKLHHTVLHSHKFIKTYDSGEPFDGIFYYMNFTNEMILNEDIGDILKTNK